MSVSVATCGTVDADGVLRIIFNSEQRMRREKRINDFTEEELVDLLRQFGVNLSPTEKLSRSDMCFLIRMHLASKDLLLVDGWNTTM